jgi:hypothetical protein
LGIARWWINASLLTGGTHERMIMAIIKADKRTIRIALKKDSFDS